MIDVESLSCLLIKERLPLIVRHTKQPAGARCFWTSCSRPLGWSSCSALYLLADASWSVIVPGPGRTGSYLGILTDAESA